MFLRFRQVAATSAVKTAADFEIPPNATGVELQASGQNVSYNMDVEDTPPTQTSGMMLLTTSPPRYFSIDEFKHIRFTRAAGSDGALNAHFTAGRDI